MGGPRHDLGFYTSWSSAATAVDKAFTFLVSHVGFICSSKQCKSTTIALSIQHGRHACYHDRESCDRTCEKCKCGAIAMHVTTHRVRSQGVCPNPSTMPLNYVHQQETSRSLPEGKGSMLIEL